jgi:hypothetical protein
MLTGWKLNFLLAELVKEAVWIPQIFVNSLTVFLISAMPFDLQFANLLSAKVLQSLEWSGGPIVLVIRNYH